MQTLRISHSYTDRLQLFLVWVLFACLLLIAGKALLKYAHPRDHSLFTTVVLHVDFHQIQVHAHGFVMYHVFYVFSHGLNASVMME